jgi:hypothetical protein
MAQPPLNDGARRRSRRLHGGWDGEEQLNAVVDLIEAVRA